MPCYYCGKTAEFVCDYQGPETGWDICDRHVCEEHSVPEFSEGRREDWTLCKDHAKFQKD